MMRIGYACIALGVEATTNRRCLLKNASESRLKELINANLQDLMVILKYNKAKGVSLFRISSDIIPFASHPNNHLIWWEEFAVPLQKIGAYIRENDMRVSMHPGQYTVLNSPKRDVVNRATADLIYHARFLDALGLDQSHKMIIHVGGCYGDKQAAIRRFKEQYRLLPAEVKKRLVLENDDTQFHLDDVLDICISVGMPVVMDQLHHLVNPAPLENDLSHKISAVSKTWSAADGVPKLHFSCQAPGKLLGSHSDTIYVKPFLDFFETVRDREVDMMLEVKDKDISAIKCNRLAFGASPEEMEDQWSCYQYTVLSHSREAYEKVQEILQEKKQGYIKNFYTLVEQAISEPIKLKQIVEAAQKVWICLENYTSDQERAKFFSLLEQYEQEQVKLKSIKNYLKRLAIKYEINDLLNSYYFVID